MRLARFAFPAVLLVAALVLAPGIAGAQHWEWPEKPANLKVLQGVTGEQLRGVMMEFTHGLGVRCVHCHAGEEGQPLSTYDFASDAKPAKETAREMMRMMADVRAHLSNVQPSGDARVEVSCWSCHRGRPRPIGLADELGEVFHKDGADSMMARYAALKERFLARGAYDFGEDSLNELGYALLQSGDTATALRVLTANAENFPASSNVWDSLGEAYVAAGDREQAIASSRKAVELEPRTRHAAAQLKELEGGGAGGNEAH